MAQVLRVDPDHPATEAVERACAVLAAGELLVYPTDTLYALGGRALDEAAVARVRRLKGRGQAKPLPLVVADLIQARSLSRDWGAKAERLSSAFWPGPLTLVVPAAAAVPDGIVAGGRSVAVRVPASVLVRSLCRSQGPLVSTSANLAGADPPGTCAEALAGVGAGVALALDGGPGGPTASTVVDLTGRSPRLVRAGAVAWEAVQEVWFRGSCC